MWNRNEVKALLKPQTIIKKYRWLIWLPGLKLNILSWKLGYLWTIVCFELWLSSSSFISIKLSLPNAVVLRYCSLSIHTKTSLWIVFPFLSFPLHSNSWLKKKKRKKWIPPWDFWLVCCGNWSRGEKLRLSPTRMMFSAEFSHTFYHVKEAYLYS